MALTKENKNNLAQFIDDLKEWDNHWLEFADGFIAKGGINGIDKLMDAYVPEEFWPDINEAVAEALEKDYKQATKELYELLGVALEKYYWAA